MKNRMSAIDVISENQPLTRWKVYNDLFKNYIKEFDNAMIQKETLNGKNYIPRNIAIKNYCAVNSYAIEDNLDIEKEIIELSLSDHQGSKVYLLISPVGDGKTTLCEYTIKNRVGILSEPSLGLLLKWQCRADVTHAMLWNDLKHSLIRTVTSKKSNYNIFNGDLDFHNQYFSYFNTNIENESIYRLDAKARCERILEFLFSRESIQHIIIIIDNADENSEKSFSIIKTVVNDINIILTNIASGFDKRGSVIWTLREKTVEQYGLGSDDHNVTNRYAEYVLDPFNNLSLIFSKGIDITKDQLVPILKKQKIENIGKGDAAKNYVLEEDTVLYYLHEIASNICSSNSNIVEFIRLLSGGNLKTALRSFYFFFHSAKIQVLPFYTSVFRDSIIKTGSMEKSKIIVDIPLFIESQLAIHYPFYDKKSLIPNIFNASNDKEPNAWANTLTIPRILLYINRRNNITKKDLFDFLISHGYDEHTVVNGFEKCFKKNLLEAPYGSIIEHIKDNAHISLTKFGKYVISELLYMVEYLQYAVGDTPMLPEYLVKITDKYNFSEYSSSHEQAKLTSTASKRERMRAIRLLLDFIEYEEKLERNMINLGCQESYASYMQCFGLSEKMTLASIMKNKVLDRITRIEQSFTN